MRLGDALLIHGVIDEEDFDGVIRSVKGGRGGRLGKSLVEKGLVSREILDAETRRHFEEIFFSCFAWSDGDFAFLPSRGELDADVAVDLPTAALIIEGVRREAAADRDADALGDPALFGRATPLTTELQSLRLSSEEAYFLAQCDGRTRLRDILRLGRSRAEAAQTLYTLLACGLIEFVPGTSGAVPAPDDPVPFLPREDSDPAADSDPEIRDARARAAYTDALTALARGDSCGAIVLLQECVHLFPYSVEYRYQLGVALSAHPLWNRRALVHFREALDLDPFREEVLTKFAETLLVEGKFDAALEVARRLAAHHPGSRSDELLARCRAAAPGPDAPHEVGRLLDHGGWTRSPGFRHTP
jgi:hypothetical protein